MSKKFSWFGLRKQPKAASEEAVDSQQLASTEEHVKESASTAAETDTLSLATESPATAENEPASQNESVEPPPAAPEQEAEPIAQPTSSTEQQTAGVVVEEKEDSSVADTPTEEITEPESLPSEKPAEKPAEEQQSVSGVRKFFSRLKSGLVKTSENIGSGVANLFLGKKIDDDLFEELETHLLMADVGIDTTLKIINNLTEHANRKQLKDADALYQVLKQDLSSLLKKVEQPLVIEQHKPYVILMVGVNGVGKTTTIGKISKKLQQQGKSVMLAAGDTFRAAAVEQLQVWGERNDVPVIAQHTGADSASVIFDAFQAAQSRGVDVLIADTAGRLQNKDNLMEELKKVVRVMQKLDPSAPHEIMLTLDAATGQNAVNQAKLFNDAVGITGINLTKLDGTAKGGVIFAIADALNIPIRYIGVGEGIDDLREFNSEDFIQALFDNSSDSEG